MNNLLSLKIDSGFARFNTIITSLKALDEGFYSKNYVRKFLMALHPKWRAKVMAIEELKDLSSLALDELISNLKVHELVMEKDSKIYKGKKKRVKSIAFKAKKESSDDETLTSGSDDEEYAMVVRNFKRCGDPNHLIGDCPKPSRNKDQKAFIGGIDQGLGSTSGIRAFALRNFDLKVMEFESAHSNTTAKLPILKLVTKMSVPVTVEEKTNKKNNVKAKSLLLMALPNEHQLTFGQYNDAKTMFIKTQIGDFRRFFDMKNIVPKESLTCLVAKATLDESMLWHRRLGHINFKNINKLVKDNLVRGLPTKRFENDQTCVACLKGKQHRASCKSKVLNPITKPLFMLHMDLFGPTFVSSLMHKKYCLVVTDDYSRFTWVFFLATKDETSEILKNFIKEIENLVDKKVKIIRCDNGTEFKNKVMDDFCREKGIRREYSVARTPQQNGVAERRNRTLIEAARTMLADSKLPTTFWAEAVSTACYVQNRVLVVKPHNKTPYELFRGKFDGKSDECFFVGYSLSSKAFRVYNTRTKKVEENLHIRFLKNKPMIEGNGPKWLFDIDSLTQSMNYVQVAVGTITNESVDLLTKGFDAGRFRYLVSSIGMLNP
ncbi:putative ribonuclease H-like domain-containing protein [Tanacetum coccineum]